MIESSVMISNLMQLEDILWKTLIDGKKMSITCSAMKWYRRSRGRGSAPPGNVLCSAWKRSLLRPETFSAPPGNALAPPTRFSDLPRSVGCNPNYALENGLLTSRCGRVEQNPTPAKKMILWLRSLSGFGGEGRAEPDPYEADDFVVRVFIRAWGRGSSRARPLRRK